MVLLLKSATQTATRPSSAVSERDDNQHGCYWCSTGAQGMMRGNWRTACSWACCTREPRWPKRAWPVILVQDVARLDMPISCPQLDPDLADAHSFCDPGGNHPPLLADYPYDTRTVKLHGHVAAQTPRMFQQPDPAQGPHPCSFLERGSQVRAY